MEELRIKWNGRYEMAQVPNQVIDVLELNMHLLSGQGISGQGKSLDLACGLGGNALRMAELGYESHAWDISDLAIEKLQEFSQERHLTIFAKQCDISQEVLPAQSFDVIIVSRFLLRDITPSLIAALRPGGLIFYQTFIAETKGELESGPQNSRFRLGSNELLQLFSNLTLRYYREEGVLGEQDKVFRNEAMLVAQKIKKM